MAAYYKCSYSYAVICIAPNVLIPQTLYARCSFIVNSYSNKQNNSLFKMDLFPNLGGVQHAIVPEKVSCIRWVPTQFDEPRSFLTSSWGSTANSVTLWSNFSNNYDGNDHQASPEELAVQILPGDIIGFEFIDESIIACATSKGSLFILDLNRYLEKDNITIKSSLKNIHTFEVMEAACTGISVYDRNAATVGEDGCLNIVSVALGKVVRSINDRNLCSMGCVSFANTDTVLVGCRFGNIDCYDIRNESDEPVITLSTTDKDEKQPKATTCINYLPTQSQIVFGGLENGCIRGWDLRMPNYYSTHFKGHDSAVNALSFRKNDPKMIFSASEYGEIWQWSLADNSLYEDYFDDLVRHHGPVVKNSLDKSINSIDVSFSHMICGGDNALILVLEIMEE